MVSTLLSLSGSHVMTEEGVYCSLELNTYDGACTLPQMGNCSDKVRTDLPTLTLRISLVGTLGCHTCSCFFNLYAYQAWF